MKKKLFVYLLICVLLFSCTKTNEEASKYIINGNAYFNDGLFDKAIECYQKAIEIYPDFAGAYYNMGIAYYNKGNYEKAIECYQNAIEIYPLYARAYYNMGFAYSDKGNYEKAIECYQNAIDIDPEDASAYNNMGIAYLNKGMDISAADSFYQAGLLYLKQNNRQKVLEIIETMKKWTPDSHLIQKLMDKLYEE